MPQMVWKVAFLLIPALWAEMVSTAVGSVRGRVVTSREVQIQHLLKLALDENPPKDKLKILPLDSKAFYVANQQALLEQAVALEAKNFNVIQVTVKDQRAGEARALKILKNSSAWGELAVTPTEFTEAVQRQMIAKKFVQFRTDSSLMPVTDADAQRHFNENHAQYGNSSFENVRESIKAELTRTQVERRLKEWYDVLLSKYQVKNLMAEM